MMLKAKQDAHQIMKQSLKCISRTDEVMFMLTFFCFFNKSQALDVLVQSQYYNENLFKCQEKEKDTKKDESKYHLVNETMLKLCSYSFEITSSVDLLENWNLGYHRGIIQ